jgi:hypothetical protein
MQFEKFYLRIVHQLNITLFTGCYLDKVADLALAALLASLLETPEAAAPSNRFSTHTWQTICESTWG